MDLPDVRLGRTGAHQHGVVSRRQCLDAGLTPAQIVRRIRTGRLEVVFRGSVYRLPGAPPSMQQQLWALWLSTGSCGTISHRSAAWVHRLDLPLPPGLPEVTVPRSARCMRSGAIVHHADIDDTERIDAAGLPVTTPLRTVLDLAEVLPPDHVELAIDAMERRRLLATDDIRAWLACDRRGHAGVAALRVLLARRIGPAPDSVPEREVRRFIERFGLGSPEYLSEIWEDGVFVGEADVLWRPERLVLEYDGFEEHAGHAKWRAGIDRDNRLRSHRWEVVHITSHDLKANAVRTARLLRAILDERRIVARILGGRADTG